MSPQSKKEYLKTVWLRYKKTSSKAEKTKILDELCTNCRFNRKYAIRRLRNFKILRRKKTRNKSGPKPKYQQPEFLAVLKQIWITANLPCSKRLKAILPIWLPAYQQEFSPLPFEILKKLSKISPASIDRVLRPSNIFTVAKASQPPNRDSSLNITSLFKPISGMKNVPAFLKPIPSCIAVTLWKATTPSPRLPSILPQAGSNNARLTAKDNTTLLRK